jgi:uncharacterized protein
MARAAAVIVHNEGATRFEMRMPEGLCIAQYRLVDGVMWLTHTEVPPAIEGRGHAAQLVRAALDHARTHGLKVQPACSYVRAYMRRHPESQDLLQSTG